VSLEENKDLIRRYLSAIDTNDADDWDLLDHYIAEDFVAHHPPAPGVTLDRSGVKQSAEIFRVGAPGTHEIVMQIAESDLVVSYIRGRGVHQGELFGIQRRTNQLRLKGSRSTGFATGKSLSTGRLWISLASWLSWVLCLTARPARSSEVPDRIRLQSSLKQSLVEDVGTGAPRCLTYVAL
jgi:predicted ester cyclase